MNKLRDYFLVPSVSEEVELDAEVSVIFQIYKKKLDNGMICSLQFKSKDESCTIPPSEFLNLMSINYRLVQ